MKKHTMQEWADWLNCYIAKDKDGKVFAYDKKTKIRNNGYEWYRMQPYLYIPRELINGYAEHDWQVLVEPHRKSNPVEDD